MTDEKQKFLAERSIDRMHLECGRVVMNWVRAVACLKDAVNIQELNCEVNKTEWCEKRKDGTEKQIDGRDLLRIFKERCKGELQLDKFPEYAPLIACLEKGIQDRDDLMHWLGVRSRGDVWQDRGERWGSEFQRYAAIKRRRMIRKHKKNINKTFHYSWRFMKWVCRPRVFYGDESSLA